MTRFSSFGDISGRLDQSGWSYLKDDEEGRTIARVANEILPPDLQLRVGRFPDREFIGELVAKLSRSNSKIDDWCFGNLEENEHPFFGSNYLSIAAVNTAIDRLSITDLRTPLPQDIIDSFENGGYPLSTCYVSLFPFAIIGEDSLYGYQWDGYMGGFQKGRNSLIQRAVGRTEIQPPVVLYGLRLKKLQGGVPRKYGVSLSFSRKSDVARTDIFEDGGLHTKDSHLTAEKLFPGIGGCADIPVRNHIGQFDGLYVLYRHHLSSGNPSLMIDDVCNDLRTMGPQFIIPLVRESAG